MAKLLEPDAQALAPTAPMPQRDRAPDELAAGTPAELREALVALVGAPQVLSRAIDLVRYASDASPYRLLSQGRRDGARRRRRRRAVRVRAATTASPITLRAAGTSLNGQAQGDGILVDVRRHWSRRRRSRTAAAACACGRGRCSATPTACSRRTAAGSARPRQRRHRVHRRRRHRQQLGRHALRRHAELLPDGARRSTFVLPSGTVIDTAAADAEAALRARRSRSWPPASLAIRDEIRADAELSERIRRKFEIKNTTGYRLCAFLDADDAAGDLPAAAGRLGGHARLHRRGGVRDRPRRPAPRDGVPDLPRHRRGAAPPVPPFVADGRDGGRADGRAGADGGRGSSPARPQHWDASCRHGRPRCWSSSAADDDGERARRSTAPRRSSRRCELMEPADVHPRPRADRRLLERARGPARAVGGCARRARR